MKKAIFILLLLWIAHSAQATEKIENIEKEIKTVLDRVAPSLVKVVAENARKYVATGIALERGLVITTSLITRHPFERISVETIKGETIVAKIIGRDIRSGLALLRLEKKGPQPLPQAAKTAVGDWVALIGLFYDRFPAITQGIISSRTESELILNAPVAPGSAGGAVVNKKGELLAVIRGSVGFSSAPDYTFKDQSAVIVVSGRKNESGNLCYAISIEQVNRIVEKLKTSGKIIPGWLGVNFSSDSNQIQEVLTDSPAAKAGISKGDRIVEISGKPIARFRDIATALQFSLAGDKIKIAVTRAGKAMRFDIELGERQAVAFPPFPVDFPYAPEPPQSPFLNLAEQLADISELPGLEMTFPRVKNYVIEFGGARQLGVDVMEMTEELSQKFLIKEGYGLLISRVNESSAAKKAGLRTGDIMVRANSNAIRSTADLRNILNALKEKEAVLLELYRDGQLKKFSLVPDKNEKLVWNLEQFSRNMENLKKSISDEAQAIYKDEIRKLKKSREKELLELQKQKELSLLKISKERRKLEMELKKLQAEKNNLGVEIRKEYNERLKKIQEEIKKLQEKIESELEKKNG
ncbi:MAG: PDZ domain-containing protein [Acidobacteria bacterium]|nr:PDZ domain-containing protein [Acidobacteriota bacterium]MBU4307554.1 PDZ domain-containing protein [Acidobacteriota bacterium]MCG2811281.1 PDZ domain-containing protein [Candidatus Aminicenantes bacterium]